MSTAQLFDIRKSERRFAFAGFFSLFGILCAHQMLETARDALFLASIPAAKLPWMYIAIALLASLVALLQRMTSSAGRQDCRPLSGLLVVASVITASFYLLIDERSFWSLSALYVWTSVMNAVILVSLWTLAGTAFSTPQARRVFPFMGVGSVLGAITGTGIARYVTSAFSAQMLLLTAAVSLIVTGLLVVPWLHGRQKDGEDEKQDSEQLDDVQQKASIKRALRGKYARSIVWLVLIGVLCTTIADFLFKSIVADIVPADELGSFFATVYLVTNSLSFFVQVFAAERMIRRLGLLPSVAALPIALLIGAGTVVAGFPVLGALVLIAADGALEHSLYRTALEILYVPFRPSVRRRIKEIIELALRNGGKAIASFALIGLLALNVGHLWIAAILGVLTLAWVFVALRTRREYVGHYQEALHAEIISGGQTIPDLDIDSVEVLLQELSQPNPDRVLAVLRLLEEEGRQEIIPALILYHPSLEVVDAALDLFVEYERYDILPTADMIVRESSNRRLRARVLRARTLLEPDRSLLEDVAYDDCEVCRSTATLLLATHGWLKEGDAREIIESVLKSEQEISRESLAHALAQSPVQFGEYLERLANDDSKLVAEAAIASLGKRKTDAALAQLLSLLEARHADPKLLEAIARYEDRAIARVSELLQQEGVTTLVRRAYLAVLGRIANQEAADTLQRELSNEENGVVRYRIVRELEAVRRDKPSVTLDSELLTSVRETLVERLAVSHEMSLRSRRLVASGDAHEDWQMLSELVDSRDENHFEVVLRISALLNAKLDADTLLYALVQGNQEQRASAREIIDSSVPASVRATIVSTMDRLFEPEEEGSAMGDEERKRDEAQLLQLFLKHPSGTVRNVAERIESNRRPLATAAPAS